MFVYRQWGLLVPDAERWGLRQCILGRYAWRVVIPIVMFGQTVAFQARSYRGAEPKYLTSKHGRRGEPGAECGRPAEALLYGYDAIEEGGEVVLVEGPGDVMRLAGGGDRGRGEVVSRQGETPAIARDSGGGENCGRVVRAVPVALLGAALTEEKAALLAAKRPGRVTVALDADQDPARSWAVAERLSAWGLEAGVGAWVGGKDAGAGARLERVASGVGLRERVTGRLGR
jgi:hypothetical protein